MTHGSDIILQRMMALHPKVIDLTLDRVWRLLGALGNPQEKLPPVIHVAGTNGKGSTVAMVRAGLEAAGHSCHVYTSPHLARFHERIRIAGDLISETDLMAVLDECYDANGGETITYFEITTCAALLAFARRDADYTLLEVGLGGRLDATNVVAQPRLTMITPVSYDHQQFLGETLAEIAQEKAGILKRAVPCILSGQMEEGEAAIEKTAARMGARLIAENQHWHVTEERGRLIFQDETGLLDLPPPALLGAHQFQNAGAAIAALRFLGLGEQACEGAVTQVKWPARMQKLRHGPMLDRHPEAEFWLDGGHNAACGIALAETLGRLPRRPTHLVCGMMNSKDARAYLAPLAPRVVSMTAVSIPGEENAALPEDLVRHASFAGMTTAKANSVDQAVDRILSQDREARVLICGSLYLAGHILRSHG